MKVNFDKYVERRGTECMKWDECNAKFGISPEKQLVPMWIADTDFKSPQPVIDALKKRVDHGIFGYTRKGDSFYNAIINWIGRRYKWDIKKEWILFTPGVIPGFTIAIQSLTEVGDGVIIQDPVYYPFKDGIIDNGRVVVNNRLKVINGRYEIDFDDLEKKAKNPRNKLMILCNPHNPIGRVWTKEELMKIGTICLENNIILISDEIHGDIIMSGHEHISIASLSEEFAKNTITTYAPSKTFNLAGLQTAYLVAPNNHIMEILDKQLTVNRVYDISVFGGLALEVAYNECEEYVDQLCQYIGNNYEYMCNFIKENLPQLKMSKPEATYLAWVDFRGTGMNNEEIEKFIIEKANIAVDFGSWFGEDGKGFLRFNVACPRSTLEKAMNQLKNALEENK